jgi:fibrillarin-like rRNA methylase
MEVSGQLKVPVIFPSKRTMVSIEQEARRAPQLVWVIQRRKNFSPLLRDYATTALNI